ncbi:MAG: hypothetical protein K9G62_00940 [Alphaproteobacteria bacterium]|nr:hypothetical protein [Alphaproteobacteria bacterium]
MYLDRFEWAVCEDGYEIEEIFPARKVGISTNLKPQIFIRQKSNKMKTYCPYQKIKNIHWKFGGLNETKQDVLSFISDYGLLGIGNIKTCEAYDEIISYKRLVEKLRNKINKDDLEQAAKIFNLSAGPNLTTQIDKISGKAIFQIYPVPRTLLSYIWLSFAAEITDGREWQKCFVCDETYPIGKHTGGTVRKKYCSDACKMKAYRQRKKS